jgi:PAS domain S-box-containing protein
MRDSRRSGHDHVSPAHSPVVRSYGMRGAPRHDRDQRPTPESPQETVLRLLVQNVLDYGIFTLDTGGHVASWNAGAERIKGYRAEEIIGQHFSVFYPREDLEAGKPANELRVAEAEGRVEDEGWRIRKDGSRFWANVVITALFDETGVLRGFGKVTRDMTERRRTEEALTERRRLLTHLVEAQEIERRRIAWDVHDDSIQSMVAVGMRLQLLAGRLPAEQAPALSQLDEAVRSAIARLRNLIFRLRPPGIDRHGLEEALSSYLNQVVAGWGLKHSLREDLDHEPSPEVATTIFRICQEALTNVRKHARATAVAVSLSSVDNGVLVRVVDDGIGVVQPLDRRAIQGHFGLVEMRERAEISGGWWTMHGEPGIGTTVEFWLPVLPAADQGPRQ